MAEVASNSWTWKAIHDFFREKENTETQKWIEIHQSQITEPYRLNPLK